MALQAKLLRVLQTNMIDPVGGTKSRSISVRVVSATNKDVLAMVKEEAFREDLYYRLCGVELTVPPLRERPKEIAALAIYFSLMFAEENNLPYPRISQKAMKHLIQYDWPGNVNQLRNTVQQALLLGDGKTIQMDDLPESIRRQHAKPAGRFPSLKEVEKEHIRKALQLAEGNKSLAADLVGVTRDTLYRKIREYHL